MCVTGVGCKKKIRKFVTCAYPCTGWQITLAKTSRWHNNISSVLAWPGLTWPGQSGTFVLKSMGGFQQVEWSPCRFQNFTIEVAWIGGEADYFLEYWWCCKMSGEMRRNKTASSFVHFCRNRGVKVQSSLMLVEMIRAEMEHYRTKACISNLGTKWGFGIGN